MTIRMLSIDLTIENSISNEIGVLQLSGKSGKRLLLRSCQLVPGKRRIDQHVIHQFERKIRVIGQDRRRQTGAFHVCIGLQCSANPFEYSVS